MKKTESYYLLPGSSIGKKGLPKGVLDCPKSAKKPLKIEPKYYDICGEVFDFLIAKGKMVDGPGLKKLEEKAEKEKADAKAKAEAEKKAEEEAAEKEKADAKAKADSDKDADKKLDALKKQAAELGLDAKKDATAEELEALINAELKK